MQKPQYIQANYTQTIEFDLDDLGIDWDKVEDYSIRYSELNILYKDGTEETYQATIEYDIDWKWANNEEMFDKDWNEIKEKKVA
jgi:hypothetical protein